MKTCTELYDEIIRYYLSQIENKQYLSYPPFSHDEIINFKLDAIMQTLDEIVKKGK